MAEGGNECGNEEGNVGGSEDNGGGCGMVGSRAALEGNKAALEGNKAAPDGRTTISSPPMVEAEDCTWAGGGGGMAAEATTFTASVTEPLTEVTTIALDVMAMPSSDVDIN